MSVPYTFLKVRPPYEAIEIAKVYEREIKLKRQH
jgi:hypothetical protein